MRISLLSTSLLALVLVVTTVAIALLTCKSGEDAEEQSLVHYANCYSGLSVQVQHVLDDQQVSGLYTGERLLTLANSTDHAIKVKLPPIRALSITPNSLNYLGGWMPEQFSQPAILEIPAKDEISFKGKFEYLMEKDPAPEDLYEEHGFRYGWVFDVPDGEQTEHWLSGTLLSEPVQWLPSGN